MREILLEFAKNGAMSKEDVAKVLKISPECVRRMAKDGRLPRIPGLRAVRFDPLELLRVLCDPPKPKPRARSLTTEGHKTVGKTNGGFLECI